MIRYDLGARNWPRAVAVPKVLRAVVQLAAGFVVLSHHVVLVTAFCAWLLARLKISPFSPISAVRYTRNVVSIEPSAKA